MANHPDVMEKLVSLAKRRGFIFQSSYFYGPKGLWLIQRRKGDAPGLVEQYVYARLNTVNPYDVEGKDGAGKTKANKEAAQAEARAALEDSMKPSAEEEEEDEDDES